MRTLHHLPRLLGVLCFTLAVLVSGSSNAFASHGPEYQTPLTVQNQFENWRAWEAYMLETLEEADAATSRAQAAELIGDALSVAEEYLVFRENQPYPTDDCAQMFWDGIHEDVTWWVRFTAANYYNFTANVGTPIDVAHIVTEYGLFLEVLITETITPLCQKELDT